MSADYTVMLTVVLEFLKENGNDLVKECVNQFIILTNNSFVMLLACGLDVYLCFISVLDIITFTSNASPRHCDVWHVITRDNTPLFFILLFMYYSMLLSVAIRPSLYAFVVYIAFLPPCFCIAGYRIFQMVFENCIQSRSMLGVLVCFYPCFFVFTDDFKIYNVYACWLTKFFSWCTSLLILAILFSLIQSNVIQRINHTSEPCSTTTFINGRGDGCEGKCTVTSVDVVRFEFDEKIIIIMLSNIFAFVDFLTTVWYYLVRWAKKKCNHQGVKYSAQQMLELRDVDENMAAAVVRKMDRSNNIFV